MNATLAHDLTFTDPLPDVPALLKSIPNWIRWKLEVVDGRPTKVPYRVDGHKAASTRPEDWADYQTAVTGTTIDNNGGVGFVVNGGIVGFDLDCCRDSKTGEIASWAEKIVDALDSYTEITPSQTGLRVWVTGMLPGKDKVFNLDPAVGYGDKVKIEVFTDSRYFTVTGDAFFDPSGEVEARDLTEVYKMLHEIRASNPSPSVAGASNWDAGEPTKIELLGTFGTSKYDVFTHGEIESREPFIITNRVGRLTYPSQSEADLGFATVLAMKFNSDVEKIEETFSQSPLFREKWLRDDYRENTIKKAIETAQRLKAKEAERNSADKLATTTDLEVREVVEPETQPSPLTLPHSALTSTVFGDLYDQVFAPNDWPMELALPALATVGSVLVPQEQKAQGQLIDNPMTSLYTALIAPIHSGKSQVIEWAAKATGIFNEVRGPHYTQVKFGSAEQMWKYLFKHSAGVSDAPTAFRRAVLVNPDEWAHVMAKAGIPDSTLASTLTTAFYNRRHTITLGGQGGGRDILIAFPFSIIGGIVEEDFDTVFDASSLGGLYDRFLFGLAPEGFKWSYRAFPYDHPFFQRTPKPVAVTAHPSLFEVIADWNKKDHTLGRIVEVCARVATIFASVDGRSAVTGADLEKLAPLAEYQKAIRGLFRPNPGMNPDAIYANVAMGWIQTHARQWRTLRDLQKGTNYHRRKLGPNVAFRSVQALARDHQIEVWVSTLDPSGQLNPLPADYTGPRPKIGAALVRVAHE